MSFDLSNALTAVQEMIDGLVRLLPNLVLAAVMLAVFVFLASVARNVIRRFGERTRMEKGAVVVLGRLTRWVVVLAGLFVALSIVAPSVGFQELLGLLGVGGVAVGFAFRDILQNFLAGLLILVTRPFAVGDAIEMAEHEGTVEEIQTRATFIRTPDGRRVVVPNTQLFTSAVVVDTAYPSRRSEYDAGIGYPDDADLARERMLEAMIGVEGVLDDPAPEVLVVELGDSSVLLRARWWTASPPGTVVRVKSDVIDAIKKALDDADIDIPYPIRTVHLHEANATA